MSHNYEAVQWNKNKKVYDSVLWLCIVLYIAAFMVVSATVHSGTEALSIMTLLIRALGSLGFILLTFILCIGPLARINRKFLPLLYNRRHLGVSMFIVILIHGILVMIWYHGFGELNPIASIFSSPGSFDSSADVPFQPLGFLALIILLVMAATSHDYWNANLGASVWKAIHMSVYLAYALVIAHVSYGAMQDSTTGLMPVLVFFSVAIVAILHLSAAFGFSKAKKSIKSDQQWTEIDSWRSIKNNSAMVVSINHDERVAIFRYDQNKLAAVSNVCKHQNGPLGEGCIIDGLITCPWHGFQYRPEDGRAPHPFTERIATYELKLDGERLLLNSEALADGTARPVLSVDDIQTELLVDE